MVAHPGKRMRDRDADRHRAHDARQRLDGRADVAQAELYSVTGTGYAELARYQPATPARETVAYLLNRAIAAAGSRGLRGLAVRMGVPH